MELDAGDLLVLATDGFFEWTNRDGEQFGAKRMEEAICESRNKRPTELIETLYKAARTFSRGKEQQDDLTAVVIKRT